MRRTLSLSKETLRILDDDDLARVVGGADPSDSSKKENHPNSGNAAKKHSSCPGQK